MSNIPKWSVEHQELLTSDKTDQQIQKSFPDKKISTINRTRRKLLSSLREGKIVSKPKLGDIPKAVTRKPRILIYDIETSPIETKELRWSIWDERAIEQTIIQDFQILSIAWTWFGESKEVFCVGQDDMPSYKPGKLNDKELVKMIWGLYNEADVVIAHNGNQFDQRKCRARMVIHNMLPIVMPKEIDTKLVAKQIGGFSSNSLKELCIVLKLPFQKGNPGGFATWKGCMAGDKDCWAKMKEYNKGDISTLQALYERFRPWMKNHPNLAQMFAEYDACPKCLAKNTQNSIIDYHHTQTNSYPLYRCKCGTIMRSRVAVKNKEKVRYT